VKRVEPPGIPPPETHLHEQAPSLKWHPGHQLSGFISSSCPVSGCCDDRNRCNSRPAGEMAPGMAGLRHAVEVAGRCVNRIGLFKALHQGVPS
jgi:hypothetical protein